MDRIPACPVRCKYCSVTEVDYRAKQWEQDPPVSMNKVVTVLNSTPKPWPPYALFESDVLGFEAGSDPFHIANFEWFLSFCRTYAPVARIATFVSKMPMSRRHVSEIEVLAKKVPVALVLSITGLAHSGIERTSIKAHVRNIRIASAMGIPCIALMHPYIHGLSRTTDLKIAEEAGCRYYYVKGFRYTSGMDSWLPKDVAAMYKPYEGREALIGFDRGVFADLSMEYVPLRQWYSYFWAPPKIDPERSAVLVRALRKHAIVTSSAPESEVIACAIERRVQT